LHHKNIEIIIITPPSNLKPPITIDVADSEMKTTATNLIEVKSLTGKTGKDPTKDTSEKTNDSYTHIGLSGSEEGARPARSGNKKERSTTHEVIVNEKLPKQRSGEREREILKWQQ